jgi:hypothetical protein
MQKCAACGYIAYELTSNHLKTHGYNSKKEYLEDYPDGLKRLSGTNTMLFQKGVNNNIIDRYEYDKITKILHRRNQVA